ALDLVLDRSLAASQPAAAEPQRGDPGLEPVEAAVTRRGEREQHRRHADVAQGLAPGGDVLAHLAHPGAEVERAAAGRSRGGPGPPAVGDDPAGRERAVGGLPPEFEREWATAARSCGGK